MCTLRIEHRVADYDIWKQAFDSDPVGRERSGVRRYSILRTVDDRDYVMIDLDFDTPSQAEALLGAMRSVWAGPARKFISEPQARIVEAVDMKEY
jgi:hypothetical protein